MGILDRLFGRDTPSQPQQLQTRRKGQPPLQPIGHADGKCPYCSLAPTRPPRQKRACEHCGKPIYPRKRPFDGKVVFLREDELEQLDEQRAIASGSYEEYLAEKQRIARTRSMLQTKFGREPSDHDVDWAILTDESMRFAAQPAFGLYRNTRLRMAQLLEAEDRLGDALELWLEVVCLDLNGVSNIPNLSEKEFREQDKISLALGHGRALRPFNRQYAMVVDAHLWTVADAAQARGLNRGQLETLFCSVYGRTPGHQLMPLSAEATWHDLSAKLDEATARREALKAKKRSKPRAAGRAVTLKRDAPPTN